MTTEANIDQTGRGFLLDAVLTMLDNGAVAMVVTNDSENVDAPTASTIQRMRAGRIVEWYPQHVKVELWDEESGALRDVEMSKFSVAIATNPLYSIMNSPNSTLRRLGDKMAILDKLDAKSASGKLDILIQSPHPLRTEMQRARSKWELDDIEAQLDGSKYGIAQISNAARITQLNRAAENNLALQIQNLKSDLYAQLGLTDEVINGTADPKIMTNYYNRTIEPIMAEIAGALKRTYLTKTAITQNQSIYYFNDPFRIVPITELAEIMDKLNRNAILSANESRGIIGYKPDDDPRSDELSNKNINQSNAEREARATKKEENIDGE